MITLILVYVLNGLTGTVQIQGFKTLADCQNRVDLLAYKINSDGGAVTSFQCKKEG